MPPIASTGRLEKLERLLRVPKIHIEGNLRSVTQAQLDFYYAAHAAMPDLLAVVRAARLAAASAPLPEQRPDDQTSDCDYYMGQLRRALLAFEEQA